MKTNEEPKVAKETEPTKRKEPDRNKPLDWGKGVFLFLLVLIPVAVLASLGVLTFVVNGNPDTSMMTTVTRAPDGSIITTTTTYMTPSLQYGALDPALGKVKGFFIGPLIFLMGSILETSLLLIYGAFYITPEQNRRS